MYPGEGFHFNASDRFEATGTEDIIDCVRSSTLAGSSGNAAGGGAGSSLNLRILSWRAQDGTSPSETGHGQFRRG